MGTLGRRGLFRWFDDAYDVTRTLARSLSKIWGVALFEFRIQYRDSRLGLLWAILTPLTQIGVYWFVFGVGLRGGSVRDGYPFVVWLVCGVTAWSHLSKGILGGAGELRSRQGLISKISIPPYVLLASRELKIFLDHALLLFIMFLILLSNGWRPDLHAAHLVYYLLCAVWLAFSLDMVFSALALIAADFRRLLSSAMRLLFFVSPIFWSPPDGLPPWFYTLFALDPLNYVITGYRNSLLYHQDPWERPGESLFFWAFTLVFYLIGCRYQRDIRDRVADF